jgi:hypothetical protein
VQAVAALLQLAGRLRAAQHEHREQGDLGVGEADGVVQQVPVLRGAAPGPAREPNPAATAELVESGADRRLVVGHDRIAVGRLVAGGAQRVQRQRIDVRRRSLLLDQAAKNTQLDGAEVHALSLDARIKKDVRTGMPAPRTSF